MLTFLLFLTLIFPQYNSREWSSITSFLTPNAIAISDEGFIYSSTSGGLLKFSPISKKFTFIKEEEGLIYLDLHSISIDNNNRVWLGGSYPRGFLQVFDLDEGLLREITHLEVNQIGNIVIGNDKAFSVYYGSTSTEVGILEFIIDDKSLPYYKDYYTNFSDSLITEISDIDLTYEFIYLTTNSGIYRADINSNLKYSSSWSKIYDQSCNQFEVGDQSYILEQNDIKFYDEDSWKDFGFDLEGIILDAVYEQDILFVLTDSSYYEILNGEIINLFSMPEISSVKTTFTSFALSNNKVYLGLLNGGILELDRISKDYLIFNPDTPFHNEYNSLLVTDSGNLVAVSKNGTLIDYGGRYHNFIPWVHSVNIPYKNYISNEEFFSWDYLTYTPGENKPLAVVEQLSNNILFSNSGIIPNDSSWLSSPAIIDLNIETKTFTSIDTSNSLIDGLWGVFQSQIYSSYMIINQIALDNNKNVWIANPYSEKRGNIVAIKNKNGTEWSHVKVPDDNSYIPVSLGFDRLNNTWIGFEYKMNGNENYSSGGLKIFQYSDLQFLSKEDSTWLTISNPDVLPGGSENASIWSIVFDEMDFVWILNEQGVRGYSYLIYDNYITLDPILKSTDGNAIDFLPQLSFVKGNKIKVDSQNNKWIVTNAGVWVIQESLLYWPSAEGFNFENSGLLSNNVYDIAFDNNDGIAYISTDKGISVLQIPFSDEPIAKENIYISPNPFVLPDDELVLIKNIASGSIIKIMTITGLVIKEIHLDSNESQFLWNGENEKGERVGSSIYIVSAYHPSEQNLVSKIAVISK